MLLKTHSYTLIIINLLFFKLPCSNPHLSAIFIFTFLSTFLKCCDLIFQSNLCTGKSYIFEVWQNTLGSLFWGTYWQCAVPENIHTPLAEGIGNSWGVGGSVRPRILKKCMKLTCKSKIFSLHNSANEMKTERFSAPWTLEGSVITL